MLIIKHDCSLMISCIHFKVKESIGSIEEYCQKLKRSHMVHGISIQHRPREDTSK